MAQLHRPFRPWALGRPSTASTTRARADAWLQARAAGVTAGLAVLAAIVRLLYWFSMRDRPLSSDAGQYHEIATHLAEGLGYSHQIPQIELHPTAFRPPLYPMLLSLLYRVTGPSQGAGRALAVVIGVAAVVATVLIVRRHAGHLAAAVAGLAVALYPPLVANDTVTLTEGFSALLLILLIDAVLRDRAVWAGVWCGLLVLTRPSAQFLIVLVAVWLATRIGWRRGLAAAAVTVAVVAPWVVRNQVVLGAPVIVTTNGFNLAAMYSQPAQDTNNFVDPLVDPYFGDLVLDRFDEAQFDQKLRDRAVADLRENPYHVVRVVLRNTGALFELTPRVNGIAEVIDGRNVTVRIWTLPSFYLLTAAGLVGMWRWRREPIGLLIALLAAYFLLSSLVLVAAPRLRAPADLMLCIALGLLAAGRPAREKRDEAVEVDAAPSDSEDGAVARDQASPASAGV
jgi:4-amino-4-deoxy-L-arabinose transferase-like glycosyltransferase